MKRKVSKETRKKISEGMKRAHARRKENCWTKSRLGFKNQWGQSETAHADKVMKDFDRAFKPSFISYVWSGLKRLRHEALNRVMG